MSNKNKVIIKNYRGNQEEAMAKFQNDSIKMAEQGYYPTSQTWMPGEYGCGTFIVALILCIILIGIVIFIYMFLVKPDGTLTVTYQLREAAPVTTPDSAEGKTCPQCAEQVKAAARICRFCGYKFTTVT